jgi:hypothetical protein
MERASGGLATKIVRIAVQILTVDGQIVEEGDAEWNAAAGCWVYMTRTRVHPETTVLIQAAAMDLPGNRATAKAYFYVTPVSGESRLSTLAIGQRRRTSNP